MTGKIPRTVTFSLLLMATAVCTTATDSLPEDYLGPWYYTGSSGGISGDGMGDTPTGYIEIRADNTIDSYHDDGTLIGTSEFAPTMGQTIFSTDDMWVLTRGEGIEQVVQISEDGSLMSLSENVYDGFSLSYARALPNGR